MRLAGRPWLSCQGKEEGWCYGLLNGRFALIWQTTRSFSFDIITTVAIAAGGRIFNDHGAEHMTRKRFWPRFSTTRFEVA